MFGYFRQFYRAVSGTSVTSKSDPSALPEAEYLSKKRAEAIAYLGDKWLGSKSKFIQHKGNANEQTV